MHVTDTVRRVWGLRYLVYCAVVLGIVCCMPQESQAVRRLIDSHGRDFWLTFLPNFHNYKSDINLVQSDSLYIYIAALRPTTGVITYRNRQGQQFQHPFSIANPAQIYTFRIGEDDFELMGFNDSGDLLNDGGQGERAAPQSFHITSDDDITVYALSQAHTTSDAFLVLPTDALSGDYMVISYTSDNLSGFANQQTPSQFAVVATEDGTEVVITPADPTFVNRAATQTVTLNRGESYLVQAYMGSNGQINSDLTGTRIEASRPVAVFAGHQRATIPQGMDDRSRDVLIEQVPPLGTWGLSAFLTPYRQPLGRNPRPVNDLYRVLAAFDGTEVYVDGVLMVTLNAGGFYESTLDRPRHLTSSAPVLVAQFKESELINTQSDNGDPFMMIIPPSEQFLPSYRFINAQSTSRGIFGTPEPTYTEQYVTVIAPDSRLQSVRLDGAPVNTAAFQPIPASGYSYASFSVSDGVHSVEADTSIGVYVYGYGDANSYGYIGGTNYSPIDFLAPRLQLDTSCFGLSGLILDDLPSDYHIERVDVPGALLDNVIVTVDEFTALRDSMRISAQLVNPYADGEFAISVLDSSGLRTDTTLRIPGFTVRTAHAVSDTDIPYERYDVEVGETVCTEVMLVNTGAFPQTVTSATFVRATPGLTVQTPLPIVIPPGDSVALRLCFAPVNKGSFADTVVIGGDCVQRPILAYSVVTGRAEVTLQVLDARSEAGRMVNINVKMTRAEGLDWTGVTRLRATLRYNATLLAFRGEGADIAVDGKNGRVTFEFPAVFEADSIVARLLFFAGLAADSLSDLALDTAMAVDGEADIALVPGMFALDGICYDGGARLINPSGRIAMAIPRPNPAETVAAVDVEVVEKGATRLEIVDQLGRVVAVPIDGGMAPGIHTVVLDVGTLASGMYHLVLRTPTEILIQRLEVHR